MKITPELYTFQKTFHEVTVLHLCSICVPKDRGIRIQQSLLIFKTLFLVDHNFKVIMVMVLLSMRDKYNDNMYLIQ